MQRLCIRLLATALAFFCGMQPAHSQQQTTIATPNIRSAPVVKLRAARHSTTDLEVGGELAGLPQGATRYVTREDLLTLPQESITVTDNPDFKVPAKVSGVALEELTRSLGAAPQSDMVVAICDDKYRANFPRDYVAAHRPVLVLKVNGQPPSSWPKNSGGGYDMGPYMIVSPKFTPSFKIFSHNDEPQIPWGVVTIELRNESAVFGAIAPRGPQKTVPSVKAGFRIAQQNCFRCHNMGREGGQKSGISWLAVSAVATASPEDFAAYVRNPQAKNPHAQMPANSGYDDATIGALTAYFQTFSPPLPQKKP